MNRTSRRKARHVRPTKIPSSETIGTVNLAPKRSIITTKKDKQKLKSLYGYRYVSEDGCPQEEECSSVDPCCEKDDLVVEQSLKAHVCITRIDDCSLDKGLAHEGEDDDDDDDDDDSLEDKACVNDDDDGCGNESSTICDDDAVESEFHKERCRPRKASDHSLDEEQTYSESENVARELREGEGEFPGGAVSSHSDWGLEGEEDDDHTPKDSDSDWNPQKGLGLVVKKRKLRRSKRVRTTKPVESKPRKTVDGRKTRWQRARAAAARATAAAVKTTAVEAAAVEEADAEAAAAEATNNSKMDDEDEVSNFTVTIRVPKRRVHEFDRPKLVKLTPDSFQCQTCKQKFASKAEGKLHLFEHQPHKCALCPGRFANAHALDSHVTDKHPATQRCSMCFYTCRTKTELRRHVITQHQVAPLPNTTLCHVCGQQFKVTINVQKHLAEVHGIVEDSLKKYVCDQCGNEYILKQSFRKHQLTHRGKIIPCQVCDKLFATHDHLRRHYNTVHLKLKKHFCPHDGCDMKFAFRRSLTSHVNMVHLKLRLFPCTWPNCERKFYAKKHLTVHLRIHNDEKPHKCNICNYACRQRAALNWHMKKHGIYHEPQDDVTKPTHSQFPANFKRGRKRTRFRKSKPYTIVETRGLDDLVKEEHVLIRKEKETSSFNDQDQNPTQSSSPHPQSDLHRQFFADEANSQYPTMVKPVSKFHLQYRTADEYNQDVKQDQAKSYSDDSSVDCGGRNSSSLPVNGEKIIQNDKTNQRLDPVRDCPTSSFQSVHFSGHPSEIPKYENPNSARASTSFQVFPHQHAVANTKINYDNPHKEHPNNLNASNSYEKAHSKVPDPVEVKYSGNVLNYSKYDKQYVANDEINPVGNATSGMKYLENPELSGSRPSGDLFHLNSDFDASQMNRVKSWINQMHMAGFQYPPTQNCFPGDTEHRLVMRKYLNENEANLRHGMNS